MQTLYKCTQATTTYHINSTTPFALYHERFIAILLPGTKAQSFVVRYTPKYILATYTFNLTPNGSSEKMPSSSRGGGRGERGQTSTETAEQTYLTETFVLFNTVFSLLFMMYIVHGVYYSHLRVQYTCNVNYYILHYCTRWYYFIQPREDNRLQYNITRPLPPLQFTAGIYLYPYIVYICVCVCVCVCVYKFPLLCTGRIRIIIYIVCDAV